MKNKIILLVCFLFTLSIATAQKDAIYKEFNKKYITYQYSDPDPIPSNKIYPYYRFDGFTSEGVEKEWKVVVLENDFISVQIMPEIGGKVWTAIEKATNTPFIYDNGVVKFRDIAMRGPWTSGGIEANYGIIGHAPTTSSPVDYLVRSNEDGSVSCFVGSLDLLTRTEWVIEVKLEKDKAYFTTSSFWFNSNEVDKPYYNWMNAGIPISDKLKFLYPGTNYIGHDGRSHSWPMDKEGHDLSDYKQNAFGYSKSYHVLGTRTNYFGALWEDTDFGMIRYSDREDKLGKKIFLWSQSEDGDIWRDLLTDDSGQYVEMQSGKLFNQNQINSSTTPFKQTAFSPYTSETWTEYWYPFKGIEGFTDANLVGAFNIQKNNNALSIKLSPTVYIKDTLFVYNDKKDLIATTLITSEPLKTVELTIDIPKNKNAVQIRLKNALINLKKDEVPLRRPLQIESEFDKQDSYGLYLKGRDLHRFGFNQQAEETLSESISKEPNFIPALVEYGKLKLFRMQYDSAFIYFQKGLSIDTYDGAANYYYGVASSKLGYKEDALDGFEVASLNTQYRNAAYTSISCEYLKQKDFNRAREYAYKALDNNSNNLTALQALSIIARVENESKQFNSINAKIEALNPLNHFARFEAYLMNPTNERKEEFRNLIRNEMPHETYLELAILYYNFGRQKESIEVLQIAPQNTEVLYWLAFLNKDLDSNLSDVYLEKAAISILSFVFPFREETVVALEWAANKQDAWQADYLLALINEHSGNRKHAADRLKNHVEKINFAPFYILKARVEDDLNKQLIDIESAIRVDSKEWRYRKLKADVLELLGRNNESLEVNKENYQLDNKNYIIGLHLVRSLVRNDKYEDAEKVLADLHVLPFEGATDARRYYRETKLMLAHLAMAKGQNNEALKKVNEAEEWPKRLGVGKPFSDLINSDLENWMKYKIYKALDENDLSSSSLDKVKNKDINEDTYLNLIKQITKKEDQRLF